MSDTAQTVPKLGSLSQKSLTALEHVVPRGGFHTECVDRLLVTIPARDAEVGAIMVCIDNDEQLVSRGLRAALSPFGR